MASMQIGYASRLLWPDNVYDLSGYVARTNPSTGVHDPIQVASIYARADEAVLIVSVAVLGFMPDEASQIRHALAQSCQLSVDQVMLIATHTHAAPATMRLNGCGQVTGDWLDRLTDAIIHCAMEAKQSHVPAKIGVGTVQVPGLARNRRSRSGPLDESLTCVKIERLGHERPIVIGNYACHPVVLGAENRMVSSDYPGAFVNYLDQNGVDSTFMTGSCGDINPVEHGDFTAMTAMGARLGQAALELLPTIEPVAGLVRSAALPFVIKWEKPSSCALLRNVDQWAAILHRRGKDGSDVSRIVKTWETWIQRHEAKTDSWPQTAEVTVQVIHIGPVQIIAFPGEVFCQIGLDLKQRWGSATLVAGFANGNIGYLPTSDAYEDGGYEVTDAHVYYGYPGVVQRGTSESMAQAASNLNQQLSVE